MFHTASSGNILDTPAGKGRIGRLCPDGVVCHEDRRSKRRCATAREMKEGPSRRTPWNKGKLIGAKPPLPARHVWSIRTKLQIERRTRDLAMFNLAIDSELRGCDVIAIRVEDIAPNGYALARATVRQRKTGRPVRFELTEQTRQAVGAALKATGKVPGEFLSPAAGGV